MTQQFRDVTVAWGPDDQWCQVTSRVSRSKRAALGVVTVLAVAAVVLMARFPTGGSRSLLPPAVALAVMLALVTCAVFSYGSIAAFTRAPSRFVLRQKRLGGWRVTFDGPLEAIERLVVVKVVDISDDEGPLSNALGLHVIAAGRLFPLMHAPRYELGGPRNELEWQFDALVARVAEVTRRPQVEWTLDQLLEFQAKSKALT